MKNNMSGPALIYKPMRMARVSGIEPRLSGNAALDFTLFLSLNINLMCLDICWFENASIATMSSSVHVSLCVMVCFLFFFVFFVDSL